MSTPKIVAIAAASLIAAFTVTTSAVFLAHDTRQSAEITQLQDQVSADRTAMTYDAQQLASLRSQVSSLSTQVSGINVPTDPLSAYNDICNQPMTNGLTQVSQTYWFPCTNSAQTIPQPGN